MSACEGTFYCVVQLPGPSWPEEDIIVFASKEPDHSLDLTYTSTGRLAVCVTPEAASGLSTARIVSCPLTVPRPTFAIIMARWMLPSKLELRANGSLIASSNRSDILPAGFTIQRSNASSKPPVDFSMQNAAAIQKRYQRFVGHQPNRKRIRTEPGYMLSSLRDELAQLSDLINLIKDGHWHHIRGLSTRLRLLVADNKRSLPLLQHCAAQAQLPLLIFTLNDPLTPIPVTPDFHIRSDFRPAPKPPFANPVDIDAWLDFTAGSVERISFSHKQFIMNVGSTVGAHTDIDQPKMVILTRRLESQLNTTRSAQSVLSIYMLELAQCVSSLASAVIESN